MVRRNNADGDKQGDVSKDRRRTAVAASPRRRGTPAGGGRPLDKETIIAAAFQLTKTTPLSDISIVRVSHEFSVTPGLIHYYLNGRDSLISGVMNSFYRESIREWPQEQDDWRKNIEVVAEAIFRMYVKYPGITAYSMSHNRYRLVQDVESGEDNCGLIQFERFVSAIKRIGLDADRTALYAYLLMDFVIGSAHSTVRHRWPGDHSEFLTDKLSRLDPDLYPSTHFVLDSYTKMNASGAFSVGLKLLLDGIEFDHGRAKATRISTGSARRKKSRV